MPSFSLEDAISAIEDGPTRLEALARLERLNEAMREQGLAVRDDSSLAYLYATASGAPDLVATKAVVAEMATAQRVYGSTQLAEHQQRALRPLADLLHREFPNVPWSVLWRRVRAFACPLLKVIAIMVPPPPPDGADGGAAQPRAEQAQSPAS